MQYIEQSKKLMISLLVTQKTNNNPAHISHATHDFA